MYSSQPSGAAARPRETVCHSKWQLSQRPLVDALALSISLFGKISSNVYYRTVREGLLLRHAPVARHGNTACLLAGSGIAVD